VEEFKCFVSVVLKLKKASNHKFQIDNSDCHPREGGDPDLNWFPAYAGMTEYCQFVIWPARQNFVKEKFRRVNL